MMQRAISLEMRVFSEMVRLVQFVSQGEAVELRLTEEGHDLVDRLVPDQQKFMKRQFSSLDNDRSSQLAAMLSQVTLSL